MGLQTNGDKKNPALTSGSSETHMPGTTGAIAASTGTSSAADNGPANKW